MKKGGRLLFLAVLITLVLSSATAAKAADDVISYLRDLFYYSNPQVYVASFWNLIFPQYGYKSVCVCTGPQTFTCYDESGQAVDDPEHTACNAQNGEVCQGPSPFPGSFPCITVTSGVCPSDKPSPDWGEKNGRCIRSCGQASGGKGTCAWWGCSSDQTNVESYDCNYCCVSGTSTGPCNPATQPSPHWGVKDGKCLPSCGQGGGEAAVCQEIPCKSGDTPIESYDCAYCCKPPKQVTCTCDSPGNPANNHFKCDAEVTYPYCSPGYACIGSSTWIYPNTPCQAVTCDCNPNNEASPGKNGYTCNPGNYQSFCPFGSVCEGTGWKYSEVQAHCIAQKTDITCTCDAVNNPETGKNCYKCPTDSSKNGCCAASEVCTKSSWKYGENPCQKTTCTCDHPDDIYYTPKQNSFTCSPGSYKSFCPEKTICSAKTSWAYGNFPCTPASEKPQVTACKSWQTYPNWKEVNGKCLPSCGHGGGASADCRQTACNSEKEENIESWDCTAIGKYCCAQKGAPGIIGADCKKPEYNIKKSERCPSVLQGCTYCTCTADSLTGQVGPGQLCCVASGKIVGQQFGAECAKDEKGKGVECPSQIKPGETCPKGCGDCWCVGGPVSCWTPAERTCCVEFLNGVQFCQPKAGGCGKDIGGGVTGLANCQINIGSGQITGKIPCQCGNKECSEKYCIDGKTCSAESGFGKITCECDYPGKTKIKTNKFTCTDSFGNQIIDGEHTACKEDDDCIGSTIFLKNSPQWPCYKKGTGPTDKPPLTECVNTGEVCGVLYKQTKRCCDSNDVCSGGVVMRCVNKKENCANTGVACMNLLVGVRSCCDENDECKRTSFFSSDCVKKVR